MGWRCPDGVGVGLTHTSLSNGGGPPPPHPPPPWLGVGGVAGGGGGREGVVVGRVASRGAIV